MQRFFNKSMALKKKVLKTMLDYKKLMKNKTKYNMWILLDCGLNTPV